VEPRPLNKSRKRDWLAYTRCAASAVQSTGTAQDESGKTVTQNQTFEIPQQLRELAETNVAQGRAAYAQFMDAMVKATNMWFGVMPANEMTLGFKVAQQRGLSFAKQNADAGFALASELANAKDIQDVLAIQSRYAQTQMHAYALQGQELGRLMAEAAQSIQRRA